MPVYYLGAEDRTLSWKHFHFFHDSHSHDKLLNVTGCNKWSAFPTLRLIGWPKCQSSARSKIPVDSCWDCHCTEILPYSCYNSLHLCECVWMWNWWCKSVFVADLITFLFFAKVDKANMEFYYLEHSCFVVHLTLNVSRNHKADRFNFLI